MQKRTIGVAVALILATSTAGATLSPQFERGVTAFDRFIAAAYFWKPIVPPAVRPAPAE